MQKRILIQFLCTWLFITALADNLDEFEGSFRKKAHQPTPYEPRPYTLNLGGSNDIVSFTEAMFEIAAGIVYLGLTAGGMYAEEIAEQREIGDPVLSVFRVNTGYQWIDDQTTAIDYSLAAGNGLIGAGFRHTIFSEDSNLTEETLQLMQGHLFYRMALHKRVEFSLGFGAARLKGDASETGFSFSSPLRLWPLDWFGLEVRPAWGFLNQTTLRDIEGSILLRIKQFSVQAGYRWMEAEDSDASLSGWRTGISWRF